MRVSALDLYRCPACGGALSLSEREATGGELEQGILSCGCGCTYPVREGVPSLVHPPDQSYVPENAATYDDLLSFVARFLNDDEAATRARMADLLAVREGDKVLEVACGPGPNFAPILARISPGGQLFALDISPEMVRTAKRRLAREGGRVEFSYANGSYLPFADATFDALLHLGTLNRFPDVPRALAEMARVVRPGGKVVAGDEGVAPWLRNTPYGQLLARFGSFFEGDVPIADLPQHAEDVCVRWILGRAYYAIEFRVGTPPHPNLDVKLPGREVTVRQVVEAKRPAKGA